LLCLLLCSTNSQSPNKTNAAGQREGEWTIWYTKDWVLPSSLIVRYTTAASLIANDKPVGIVKDYYRNGKVQWEGFLLADRPEEVMEGKGIGIMKNGSKEVEREFKARKDAF
jgi:antitoxin component YwqK of YwqJK toxin-antitoxin module